MSERSEAAQKWAEAKEGLDVAQAAADAAHAALNSAVRLEAEAWEALQALAGRKLPELEPEAEPEILYSTGAPNEPIRHVYRHSLAQKPIG